MNSHFQATSFCGEETRATSGRTTTGKARTGGGKDEIEITHRELIDITIPSVCFYFESWEIHHYLILY